MKLTVDLALTPAQLAAVFCDWNDEQQAQFFIECARIAATWKDNNCMQWWMVGGHLRDCACATDEAREIVLDMANAIKTPRGTHVAPKEEP